jgi:hypothetical protein
LDPNGLVAPHYIGHDSPSIFNLAFYNVQDAENHLTEVIERFQHALPDLSPMIPGIAAEHHLFRFLPPLFVLSQTKYMLVFETIILIAQEDGPIIPVVSLQSMRENSDLVYQNLCLLYCLNHAEYQTLDSLREFIQQKHSLQIHEEQKKLAKQEKHKQGLHRRNTNRKKKSHSFNNNDDDDDNDKNWSPPPI